MPPQFNPIGWCHFTVNFWWGCSKVSDACRFCYAQTINQVYGRGRAEWGADGRRWLRVEAALNELRAYDKKAAKLGVRWRIFINSMSDTFEDRRDLDAARAALFTIAPTLTNLDLLLLTKRPEKVDKLVDVLLGHGADFKGWPRNIWLGVTAETQADFGCRATELGILDLVYNFPVIFFSCEPLLGPIDFGNYFTTVRRHSWVICGGESGPQARPMHPAWAHSLRDQCQTAGVPFYFKQNGEWLPFIPIRANDYPQNAPVKNVRRDGSPKEGEFILNGAPFQSMIRVGKKVAGRLLDGIEHNEFPKPSSSPAT